MNLHLLAFDFRHTPIALREKVAFPEYKLAAALQALQQCGANEAAILSTCNRVELIAHIPSSTDGHQLLLSFLSQWHDLPQSELESHSRHFMNEDAAHRLMCVTCGLESLVPGEMQILGQVKNATHLAREAGTLGKALNNLFDKALKAGRRARNETKIARRPVSISHVAVNLIQQHFGRDLNNCRVLLIGSGKMGEVAAQQLHKAGATHMMVANRTLESACKLAQRWDGEALSLDQIYSSLSQVDAVICATGAPHLILHQEELLQAMNEREGKPLLLVDLAVPRDIDPSAKDITGITLCDVDGLQAVVADNIALRNEEREDVESIVQQQLKKWQTEQAVRRVAPTITSLRGSIEKIRKKELEKALGRLTHLSDKERSVVESLTSRLMNQFLHEPTMRLRKMATTNESAHFQQTVEELFALKGEPA